jgi:hypothetical protein
MSAGPKRRRAVSSIIAAWLIGVGATLHAEPVWITHPEAGAGQSPVVLHFRRSIDLTQMPASFPIEVSADNRFVLYVNGARVAAGPARGILPIGGMNASIWPLSGQRPQCDHRRGLERRHAGRRYSSQDQPAGTGQRANRLLAPWARRSRTIDSGAGWRVAKAIDRQFTPGFLALKDQLGQVFYAAGSQETVDGAATDKAWQAALESGSKWTNAVPALATSETSPWTLVEDKLPQMLFSNAEAGHVVRSDLPGATNFPKSSTTVPAHSEVHILLDRGTMISAYPALALSGGKGAQVTLRYAEALYDADKKKGDRNEVGNRQVLGLADRYLADGTAGQSFAPLWWRTWRYLDIAVKTTDAPLTLDSLSLRETGYPFEKRGSFVSDDPALDAIWKIGWRTTRIDAHETFMDSSYWEQLQYTGDTRLMARIAYAVSGDARLPVQAIDAFGNSQYADGTTESAYPNVMRNIIPPFSLLWVGMMHDYWMEQPDTEVLRRNLPKTRKVFAWYAKYIAANGLLTRNPEWNFVDWVGEPTMAREAFPSFDKASGTSCMTSLVYLGALGQAADLERALGDGAVATDYERRSSALRKAINGQCWDAQRRLYADDPSKTVFSQHTNSLAVLYDVAPRSDMKDILTRTIRPEGIEAPDGILESSYYFAWYLVRAVEHAGWADHYPAMLTTWRGLMGQHFTTWPERRGNTRSDTHAWSAHPTADLLGIVAGIQTASPGYGSVRVEPHPGALHQFKANAATPHGIVSVVMETQGDRRIFDITLPDDLPGSFAWHGTSQKLHSGRNLVTVAK